MKESRKTQYTRQVIRSTLIDLMKTKPFDKITVTELCKEADINRVTFYAHYEDQMDLLKKIEAELMEWIREQLKDWAGQDWRTRTDAEHLELVTRVLTFVYNNSGQLKVLMSENGDREFQKRFFSIVYSQAEESVVFEDRQIKPEDDKAMVFIINGGIGLVQNWLKNGLRESPRELAEFIFTMVAPLLREYKGNASFQNAIS